MSLGELKQNVRLRTYYGDVSRDLLTKLFCKLHTSYSMWDANSTTGVQFPSSAKYHVMLNLGKSTLP